jgi:hypothetical protein
MAGAPCIALARSDRRAAGVCSSGSRGQSAGAERSRLSEQAQQSTAMTTSSGLLPPEGDLTLQPHARSNMSTARVLVHA